MLQESDPFSGGDALSFARRRSRPRGFTVIELMVGLAIVGVLASIAWPHHNASRNKSRALDAAQRIGVMQVAIARYHDDNRAWPASLADVGFDGAVDPWGRPYVYYNVELNGRAGSRKDKQLNPINADYDLYSKGVDGLTAIQLDHRDSLDDVVRARNGGYIGPSADF